MKLLIIFLLATSILIPAEQKKKQSKKDAAQIELLLRQQRELEADELILAATKNLNEGNFIDAEAGFKKAISLYQKSSSSEKRITAKITQTRILLVNSLKKRAEKLIKQADKESSVKLYNKAEQILLEAKKINEQIPGS